MWDVEKAVQYLNEHAESSSIGYCARYVKRAISAGGDITAWPSIVSAKDYGSALLERGFQVVPVGGGSIAGDVVIIQGIKKSDFPAGEINRDHPHGHMAMYNGSQWVSDFKQNNGFYPGGDYRRAKPACVFYRHKDVNTAASGENAPVTHSALKTCFPARKQNGENYATLDEMMGLIGQEPHGSWLAGTNRMWHGGIHITEKSAPGSVLTTATMESAVPLQCMAGGEVVAWRLNQDYQKKDWSGQPLQYTTTFVLVKSMCQPDPNNAQTRLEFYSLYMGLAPLSAFQKRKCMKVKATSVMKHPYERYEGSQPGTIPATRSGVLATNSRVLLLKEGLFNYKGQANQPFGLAQVLDKDGNATGEPFWVTTSSAYMDEDGEQYARLPVWMQHAVAKGTFDAVVKPEAPLTINAGDAIGFLGEDIVPYGTGRTSRSAYAHIEVLSADAGMPAFLDNPGQVKTGRKYIRVHPDAMLYTNTGNTFTRTSTAVSKDMHIILPVDKCNPKQSDSKTYYQVGQQYWLYQDDVDVIEQYFLKELGFTALEEENTPDMAASLREGWMKSACQWLSKQVMPERGIQEQQMSRFYKGVVDKLDADHDGQLSGQELYVALQHPEMGVRDIVSRMVVRHESEWYGGSGHQKWAAFFQDYDRLRIDYAKKWLDDMEWMSQVEPFTSGKAVWHMHPVMFLSALSQVKKKDIIFPLKVKPKNDVGGVWKQYYWAASLTGANASQAIFGRNRSGGARKHAARDLYTDPLAEIVAVSNGVVRSISHYYYGTWQVTVEHKSNAGRHFYIRYGEVDPNSITVKVGEHLTQGMTIAKTGLMVNPATGQHPNIIPGQVVYMLHFEYYPGNATTPPPNNIPTPPYYRREDLCDPLDILQEGYQNTFSDGAPGAGERVPISSLSVSSEGMAFIKGWESFKSKAYNDSEGFCTIGYGHLIARAKCEDIILPDEFKNEITVAKADELFESRLSGYVSELKRTVTVDLHQYEFDALISLLFNLGRMNKAPQLNAKLNRSDYSGASTEFLDITNGGVSGLVKRRKKEQGLFLNGIYDSSH